jgi:hypothetical protein
MTSAAASAVTRHAVIIAILSCALLTTLPLLFGFVYTGLDLYLIDVGVNCAVRDALASGELSMTPFMGAGTPLFDTGTQLLYPLRWPMWLFDPETGASLFVVVHLALGAGAMTWLLRTFRVRPTPATVVGLGYAATGTVQDLILHGTYLIDAVWIPVGWLAARRALRLRPDTGALIVLATASTCFLLGGTLQGFAMLGGPVALECFAHRRVGAARVALVIAAFAIGSAIGLPALLPLVEEAGQSLRMLGEIDNLRASLNVPKSFAILLPIDLKEPLAGGLKFAMVVGGPRNMWNATPYLGGVAVAFAIVGARRRGMGPTALVGVGALIFALGRAGVVLPLAIEVVPFLDRFRYPEKWFMASTVAAVVLVGVAVDRGQRRSLLKAAVVGTFAAGFVALGLFLGRQGIEARWTLLRGPSELGAEPMDVIFNATLLALIPSALVIAGLALKRGRRTLGVVTSLGVAATWLVAANAHLPVGERVSDLPSPIADSEGSGAVCISTKSLAFKGLPAADRWVETASFWLAGMGAIAACHETPTATVYTPIVPWPQELLRTLQADPFGARALGCTEIFERTKENPMGRLRPAADPPPRAWIVRDPTLVSRDQLRAALEASDPRGFQWVTDPFDALGGELRLRGELKLTSLKESTSRVDLVVEGEGTGVVALRRTLWRGWRATADDGDDLPVVRVGFNQLGIVLSKPGAVQLRYRPPGLGVAVWVSSFGLGALLVLLLIARHIARTRHEPS